MSSYTHLTKFADSISVECIEEAAHRLWACSSEYIHLRDAIYPNHPCYRGQPISPKVFAEAVTYLVSTRALTTQQAENLGIQVNPLIRNEPKKPRRRMVCHD